MDKEFCDLFGFIENIVKRQELQKLRGLNDYNMVNAVRKANLEVGMHSNVLYSLLDPNGLHYQGELFLSLFIDKVLGINPRSGEKGEWPSPRTPERNGGQE